ncbi:MULTISPECIES: DUF3679 domain-containing protein [Brevibacillus]|jgi:hypothetical protein|uniref:DUF3679 domain-containing protein n=1 Tax=Brevibacillus borstelensis AK1 TaxID=1300222 RepID=M8DBI7_9BACL|nr:DUF3679 domain-containing protein [Brevibacillus borstelensis]EMT50778.1 hypothetical protein I532_20736 [Brevibacillus borstelensis AK1]MED1743334.1 DUF3679 domain-containing protein [Brevibacillus borstelensis]MED1853146.1 DUF3679 domain-containing protein [Brevibacillus borstelensis]NOU57737.1 DUF3679 domain-containing protein [Brevibacillus borstelensis]
MNVTVKLTGLLFVLLIGVVLGLQTAERGIQKVSGMPEQPPQTFSIKKIDNGKMEIAVMGKQVQTAPGQVVNYMSNAGQSLGQIVKDGARVAIEWLASIFDP